MKKIVILSLFCILSFAKTSAQAITKEVQRLMDEYETVKKDETKTLDVRKVATFKYDALYYLKYKAGQSDSFTESEYGNQASAMIDFVNLFVKQYDKAKGKDKKLDIMYKYMNASTTNPLFNDTDKEVVDAYVNNPKYITQFALDTDWKKALAEVAKK
jgi:hypothetical protein